MKVSDAGSTADVLGVKVTATVHELFAASDAGQVVVMRKRSGLERATEKMSSGTAFGLVSVTVCVIGKLPAMPPLLKARVDGLRTGGAITPTPLKNTL